MQVLTFILVTILSFKNQFMKKIGYILISIFFLNSAKSQSPCTSMPVYRQFDFWLGEWEAFEPKGTKSGDSKISHILDSCIILEEWTSQQKTGNLVYAGKSFNTYNAVTNQWQQTWVDNSGGTIEYLEGKAGDGNIIFMTRPFAFNKDTMAIRKLSFNKLSADKVRQHGEISKDNGTSWKTEFDLEYRRKLKSK